VRGVVENAKNHDSNRSVAQFGIAGPCSGLSRLTARLEACRAAYEESVRGELGFLWEVVYGIKKVAEQM